MQGEDLSFWRSVFFLQSRSGAKEATFESKHLEVTFLSVKAHSLSTMHESLLLNSHFLRTQALPRVCSYVTSDISDVR